MPGIAKTKPLYVKSYFAASIPEAMKQALQELGVDALLLNSREAPPEARHLGAYEVVFGRSPEPVEDAPKASPAKPAGRAAELDRLVREMRGMLGRKIGATVQRPVEASNMESMLVEAGVEPELAREIEDAVRKKLNQCAVLDIARPRPVPEHDSQSWLDLTMEEMAARMVVQPEIGRVAALVGPPGSGKTTTLAKLAITQCLAAGHPVRLVSADSVRIGAAEQLRTYATILGVPFQAVDSTAALARAVDSTPSDTFLLIDTPGLSAGLQQDLGGDLARFLSRRQDIDTHLVLTASMDRVVLRDTIGRFEAFNASKLLFTRLDETTSHAAIFCEAARTRKPLSFFSHGQSVPEDLGPASREQVIESLVSQLPKTLRSVA